MGVFWVFFLAVAAGCVAGSDVVFPSPVQGRRQAYTGPAAQGTSTLPTHRPTPRPVVAATYTAPQHPGRVYTGPQNQAPARKGPQHQAPARKGPQHQAPARKRPQNQAPARKGPQHQAPARSAPRIPAQAYSAPQIPAQAYSAPQQPAPQQPQANYGAPTPAPVEVETYSAATPVAPQKPQRCYRKQEVTCGVIGTTHIKYGTGMETTFGQDPWHAAILEGSNFLCSATLLGDNILITAATCVDGRHPTELTARLGDWDILGDNRLETFEDFHPEVSEIILHPYFDPEKKTNDVALVLFAPEVDFVRYPHVRPICLPDHHKDFNTATCRVAGWSESTQTSAPVTAAPATPGYPRQQVTTEYSYSRVLNQVGVTFQERQWCERDVGEGLQDPYFRLDFSQVCLEGVEGGNPCKGDIGSPVSCVMPSYSRHRRSTDDDSEVYPTVLSDSETVYPGLLSDSETVYPGLLSDSETVYPGLLSDSETVYPGVPSDSETVYPGVLSDSETVYPGLLSDSETVYPGVLTEPKLRRRRSSDIVPQTERTGRCSPGTGCLEVTPDYDYVSKAIAPLSSTVHHSDQPETYVDDVITDRRRRSTEPEYIDDLPLDDDVIRTGLTIEELLAEEDEALRQVLAEEGLGSKRRRKRSYDYVEPEQPKFKAGPRLATPDRAFLAAVVSWTFPCEPRQGYGAPPTPDTPRPAVATDVREILDFINQYLPQREQH